MSRMNKQPSCSRFWWLNRPQTGSTACWPRQKDKLQTWNILSRISDSDTRHRKRLWWRWCRNCIPRQQQQEESVDDYCTQMLKLAKIVQVYLRLYTLVNGLRPETATYVTQRGPKSVNELLTAARTAKITITLSKDLSLHAKVDKLMDTWQKMTIPAVYLSHTDYSTGSTWTWTICHHLVHLGQKILG